MNSQVFIYLEEMLVKLALPSRLASLREDCLSMSCFLTHFTVLCGKGLSFTVKITKVISNYPANSPTPPPQFYTMSSSCLFIHFQNEYCDLFLFSYKHKPI